ncbi:hypothetical protein ACTFIV_006337 [Dictyostelium citrinum]
MIGLFKDEWFNISILNDDLFIKRYCYEYNNNNNNKNNNTLDTIIIPFDKSINPSQFDPSTINDYFVFLYKNTKKLNLNNINKLKYKSNKKEILISFDITYIHNNNKNNNNNNNNLKSVLISKSCAKKLNLLNNDIVHLKPIKKKLTVLQRVVLLANDNDSFIESSNPSLSSSSSSSINSKYLVNEEFRNYLVDNSILFQSPNNIIIENHQKHKSFSYKVLECFPLLQGTVSNSTTIIIISPDDKILNSLPSNGKKELEEEKEKEKEENENENENELTTNNNNLRLSNFIIHPIDSTTTKNEGGDSNLFHFTPSSKGILSNSKKFISISQLKSVPTEIDFEFDISKEYDYLVDCLVSLNTLKSLNLFNGSWIKIKNILNNTNNNSNSNNSNDNDNDNNKNNNNSNNNEYEIAIRIFSIASSSSSSLLLKDQVIYLPPISIFNLNIGYKNFLKLSNHEIISNQFELVLLKSNKSNNNSNNSVSNSSDNFPINYPTANRIKISRVKNQNSSGYKSYSSQLENYFQKKRLLKQNDIIVISTTKSNNEIKDEDLINISNNNNNNNYNNSNILIYFKVETILCNQFENINGNQIYLIDKNTTSIIQEGSSSSMIPSKIESFYWRSEEENSIPLELVYENEFKTIVDLILPFLMGDKFSFDFNCTLLLNGPQGVGKRTLLNRVAKQMGIHVYEVDCYKLYDFVESKKDWNIRNALEQASNTTPTLLILKNFEVLEQTAQSMQQEKKESNLSQTLINILKDINDSNNSNNKYPLIITVTVNSMDELSNKVRNWFKHEITLNSPDENQRFKILKYLTKNLPIDIGNTVSIKNLSIRTASFLNSNLRALIQRSSINALKRVLSIQQSMNDEIKPIEIYNCGFLVMGDDIQKSLSEMQEYQSSSIGAPKIPNVSWDDVGGLANVKSEIMDTIQLPLEHPHLFASGIGKRSGILLFGPPGTGKTLLAKAIATECSLNFLSVKGPELINMYIGESEKNIREIFNKARQAKPCVIFFDELDSLAPSRGNGADSGGVMDRVVSQLLAELDGMQKSSDVFIIGATNRPDLLDSSLMRPGRLDRLLYLGISSEKENQFKILQALTRKFNLADDVDLRKVVENCPMNLTGADFYALASDAMSNAFHERITASINGEINEEEQDQKLIVHQNHFIKAVNSLVPSVSLDELEYYHKVQKQFSGNKK